MTINLRDGTVYPARREDHCTKASACPPKEMPIPLWLSFLETVTDTDAELQRYLQRLVGYCLTGLTSEHALFFLYGTGANGKSVFLNTLRGIWGDYAVSAPMETFVETKNDRDPTQP